MGKAEAGVVGLHPREGTGDSLPVYSIRVASKPPQYKASAARRKSIIRWMETDGGRAAWTAPPKPDPVPNNEEDEKEEENEEGNDETPPPLPTQPSSPTAPARAKMAPSSRSLDAVASDEQTC